RLAARGASVASADTLAKLRARFDHRNGEALRIPRLLGARPELGLALLEEVAGEAKLHARRPAEAAAIAPLLATAARVAAALHGPDVRVGPARTFAHELAQLAHEVEFTRLLAPASAERASGWLEQLAAHAARVPALPAALCHGDWAP